MFKFGYFDYFGDLMFCVICAVLDNFDVDVVFGCYRRYFSEIWHFGVILLALGEFASVLVIWYFDFGS